MIKYIAIILIFLLVQCDHKQESVKTIYHIVQHQSAAQYDSLHGYPMPPMLFYGHHNFIITDSSIYYHALSDLNGCIFQYPDKPGFIYLDTSDIQPIYNLKEFIAQKIPILKKTSGKLKCSISSFSDTIYNPAFDLLATHFKKAGIYPYTIRNVTEQEACALNHKLRKQPHIKGDCCECKIGYNNDIPFEKPDSMIR